MILNAYKSQKFWKEFSGVIIDGGVGVIIMSKKSFQDLGLNNVKNTPSKVCIEGVPMKVDGANINTNYLVLDVSYSMLLGDHG